MTPRGWVAEFADAEALAAAVRAAVAARWSRFDAYAPHPVPEAAEAMGVRAAPVGWWAASAGALAGASAYALAWWASTRGYPLNVGGRPTHAWPVFLPVAYIVGVLAAALAALLAMLLLNRLPRFHHPAFEAPGFLRASEDRFFLILFHQDPTAERFLRRLGPLRVSPLP